MRIQHDEHVWHREVIGEQMERTLKSLQALGVLDRFNLAWDTGLGLRLGHRRSHDLDFMNPDPVDSEALIRNMKTFAGFAVKAVAPDTLHAEVEGAKVSFFAYPYRALFPFESFLGVNVADPCDSACMKISAIASRGVKRDFVDLYFVAKRYGVPQLLEWFKQKYAEVHLSLRHVRKSLTWFEDAEDQPMPDMLVPLLWEEVKRFFMDEVPRLAR